MTFKMYDAFETKTDAKNFADDLRKQGSHARVKETNQDGGRLKWAVYTDDRRLV